MDNKILTNKVNWSYTVLFIIFIFAFFIRTLPYLNITFIGEKTIFHDTDPYYHMRRITYMLRNNFKLIEFDYYLNYPEGAASFWPGGFARLVACFVWILSGGNPTKESTERIACWFPPFIGALTIFPIWFIGKELFSNKVGLLSAFLFAIQPTHIDYSKLGKIDHHVTEVFSALLIYLFFIKLLKSLKNNSKKSWLFSCLTGMSIWFSYIMWSGATLYVLPVYMVAYISLFLIDQSNRKEYLNRYICLTVIAFLFLLYPCLTSYYSSPEAVHFLTGKSNRFTHDALSFFQLSVFLNIVIFFVFCRFVMAHIKSTNKYVFCSILLILTVMFFGIVSGICWIFIPQVFVAVVEGISLLAKKGGEPYHVWLTTISEYMPLVLINGKFLWQRAIFNLSYMIIFLPLAIAMLFVELYRFKFINNLPGLLIFLTTLIFGLLAFQQLRYCYIFGFNVALLSSYAIFKIYSFLKESKIIEIKFNIQPFKKVLKMIENSLPLKRYPKLDIAVIFAIFVAYLIIKQLQIHALATFSPLNRPILSLEDYKALLWLKENTPNPGNFNDPTTKPSYGIMNIWDWGHFIGYIAERPAAVNPYGMGINRMVKFYLAKTEKEANRVMEESNSRYVITSDPTPLIDGLRKITMKYPGETYRLLQFEGPFLKLPKHEFLNLMGVKLHLHDGVKPYVPDMDVEGLGNYRLIYESEEDSEIQYLGGPTRTKKLKIFEYVKGAKYLITSKPRTEIKVSLKIQTNTDRLFLYENRLKTDEKGKLELSLPYSTIGNKYPTKAIEKYIIEIGEKKIQLDVPEEAVVFGRKI